MRKQKITPFLPKMRRKKEKKENENENENEEEKKEEEKEKEKGEEEVEIIDDFNTAVDAIDFPNLGTREEVGFEFLKKKISREPKGAYNDLTKKISGMDEKKRKETSTVQKIITNMYKSNMKGVAVGGILRKNKYDDNEVNFYKEIINMRVYTKKLYIPKTLCVKPIEIYFASFGEDINSTSYFTNDLLFWAFKFKQYLTDYYKENQEYLIEKCINIKSVSISTATFKLNHKEMSTGYIQDYSEGISFPGYENSTTDVIESLLDPNARSNDFVVNETTLKMNDINYKVRYVDDMVLIYNESTEIKKVKDVIEKQIQIVHKDKTEFTKGLRRHNIKEGIFYIQTPKINLTNFSPAILKFSPTFSVKYNYLITAEVDLSKFADLLYTTYHLGVDKSKVLKKEELEKIKKEEAEKIQKKIDVLWRQGVDVDFKSTDTYKELIQKKNKRKKNDEKLHYGEEIKDDGYIPGGFNVNDYADEDFVQLDEDFIFWDNIPSCFEFIGIIGYTAGIKSKASEILTYIYRRYVELRDAINAWKKCYDIFRGIITSYYDSCSTRVGYDKIVRLSPKIAEFFRLYNILINSPSYKLVVEYFKSIVRYSTMINNFLNNKPNNVVAIIEALITNLRTFQYKNLEDYLRSSATVCLSCFYGSKTASIPEIRSISSFLGSVQGKLSTKEIKEYADELLGQSIRQNEKGVERIQREANNLVKHNEEMKTRLLYTFKTRNIKDPESLLKEVMENEKLKEELTIAHLKDMLADKNVKKEYLTLPFNNSTLLRMMQTRMEEDKLKNQENKINLEKEKVDAQLKLNEVNKKLDENKEENKEEIIDTSTNKKNISDLGTEMYNMAAKINKSSGYKDYFNLFKDVIVNENLNYEEIVSKYESIYGSKRGGEKNDPNTVIAFLLERIREVRPKEEGQQDQ